MYDKSTSADATNNRPSMDTVLSNHLGNLLRLLRCPSDRNGVYEATGSSYSWNSALNGQDAAPPGPRSASPTSRTRFP